VAVRQGNQQSFTVAKGDAEIPSRLAEDLFAPDLALRTGHHILYLMQVRAALVHRPKAGFRTAAIRRKRALGA